MNARIPRGQILTLALLLGTLGAPALSPSGQASAQSARARLSPLPGNGQTVRTSTGLGQGRATLAGNRRWVAGEFGGLSSPATSAQLHVGPPGQPGPAAGQLTVSTAAEGQL